MSKKKSQAEEGTLALGSKLRAIDDRARVLQCFVNVDMRNGHEGLAGLAKSEGINVSRIVPGQYVVFINRSQNKLKVYASNQVIAYHRAAGGRLDLNMISELPRVFASSRGMDFDAALRASLEKRLYRPKKRKILEARAS